MSANTEQKRRTIIRGALLLGAVAALFYFGFIAMAVFSNG